MREANIYVYASQPKAHSILEIPSYMRWPAGYKSCQHTTYTLQLQREKGLLLRGCGSIRCIVYCAASNLIHHPFTRCLKTHFMRIGKFLGCVCCVRETLSYIAENAGYLKYNKKKNFKRTRKYFILKKRVPVAYFVNIRVQITASF